MAYKANNNKVYCRKSSKSANLMQKGGRCDKPRDHLSFDMTDDIFYDLRRANDQILEDFLENRSGKVYYIQRSTMFPAHYITMRIHNYCKSYQFNQTIECFAIELFDRIFDKLFIRYSRFDCDSMVRVQLNELVNFNLTNPIILFNSTLCSSLFYRFFVDLKNADLLRKIDIIYQSPNDFLEKCFNIICFVCIFLSQKLHGDRLCKYNMSQCIKIEEKRSSFPKEFYIIKHHFPLIESKVLELIKFNLHIDTLNSYIDCLLSIIRRKLKPEFVEQLNFAQDLHLRPLAIQFYRHRVALLKSVIEEGNQLPFASDLLDSIQLERLCLNKLLQSSALILASSIFVTQANKRANLSYYVLDLLVSITRLSPRIIVIFANNLCKVQANYKL